MMKKHQEFVNSCPRSVISPFWYEFDELDVLELDSLSNGILRNAQENRRSTSPLSTKLRHGRGHGNLQGCGYFGYGNSQVRGNTGATSQPKTQSIGITVASLHMIQSCNPRQGPLETGKISSNPLQRPSLETQSSINVAESIHASLETENGGVGYVRGKGDAKKPPKKSQLLQANLEASLSYTIKNVRQEMQVNMDRKSQEEHE